MIIKIQIYKLPFDIIFQYYEIDGHVDHLAMLQLCHTLTRYNSAGIVLYELRTVQGLSIADYGKDITAP